MKFGMSDEQFDLLDRLVVKPLKQAGAEVFIFGSRATGRCHPYSDVDLLYCTRAEIRPIVLSNIREAIEESNFPFKVDLVDDKFLADSYRQSVETQKQKL